MKSKAPKNSIHRIIITGILIFIQLIWFVLFFTKLSIYATWVTASFLVLSILMVLYIVSKDENPAYKIGWIIFIALFPLLGGMLYLFFGNKAPSRKMQSRFTNLNPQLQCLSSYPSQEKALCKRMQGLAHYVRHCGGYPVFENTQTTYYSIGEDMHQAILQALEQAEHFIFLEFFIIMEHSEMWKSILSILERKAAQGVEVRLIYDDFGSLTLVPSNYPALLKEKGIQCIAFNPLIPFLSVVMNHRDHRKILCIDGHTAFNGGINLSDEYINVTHPHGHWKDTGVKLYGEAAFSFTVLFLQMWNAFCPTDEDLNLYKPDMHKLQSLKATGYLQPFGDSPLDAEPLSENIYIDILYQAKKYVYITTPYLAISNEMQTALCTAAKRGVDVRIITPGKPDKKIVYQLTRSYYAPLIRAGVQIYEYTPGFIHAKSYLCDDRIGVVGTINMDYRSLYLHFECGTLMYECAALNDLKKDFLQIFPKSHLVLPSDYRQGILGHFISAILRVLAPLF